MDFLFTWSLKQNRIQKVDFLFTWPLNQESNITRPKEKKMEGNNKDYKPINNPTDITNTRKKSLEYKQNIYN